MGVPCILDDANRHRIHPNVWTPCLPSNAVLMMWLCLQRQNGMVIKVIPTIITNIYRMITMCQELF